jgi:hypothetical protein
MSAQLEINVTRCWRNEREHRWNSSLSASCAWLQMDNDIDAIYFEREKK